MDTIQTIEKFEAGGDRGGDPTSPMEDLRLYIDNELESMKRFRDQIGFVDRLNTCLRLREGAYDSAQLMAIQAMGGSEVFARLTTNKIRGGAAMLRSIFVQGDRPWEIKPTPVPSMPDDIGAAIETAVQSEAQMMQQGGQQISPDMIKRRIEQLSHAAQAAARKQARLDASDATLYIDDILTEGDFYKQLNGFILDFTTYPCAFMAGPTAIMKTGVQYNQGKPVRARKAVLTYRRVDPYDIMWSPGSTDIGQADVLERLRLTRAQLNALIGLDGYDENAIRSVLRDYGQSGHNYNQFFEQVRETAQNRESLSFTHLIDVLAFTGSIDGKRLTEWGIPAPEGTTLEDDLDYQVQAWVCGRYILKAQVDPDPSNYTGYYSAAYEPVPGSIPGTSLPELIADIQETYNATLRALVNNVGISSGPLVGLNRDRARLPGDKQIRIAPWQVIEFDSDPSANAGEKPIEFWQASLNAQELMAVLSFLQNMADEISGIPRYLTGSDKVGGAGRTSSGLSMLMGNATRTMTSVAQGIDDNLLGPLLSRTYILVQLTTGTDVLRGDETIVPKGATYAEQREQDRMRQIEFLNTTMNPVDLQIMGIGGRAKVLRKVASSFMGDEEVVPDEQTLDMMQNAQKQQAQQQDPNAPPEGGPPGASEQGGTPPAANQERAPNQEQARPTDNASRVRSQGAIARGTRKAA